MCANNFAGFDVIEYKLTMNVSEKLFIIPYEMKMYLCC